MRKLIRDKLARTPLPAPRIYIADETERAALLRGKIREEAIEVASAVTVHHITEELADLLEVMQAFAASQGIEWDMVRATQSAKFEVRGGFSDGYVLAIE